MPNERLRRRRTRRSMRAHRRSRDAAACRIDPVGRDSVTDLCELIDLQAQPTLVVRTRAPVARLPHVLGRAWGAIMARAARAGAEPSSPPGSGDEAVEASDRMYGSHRGSWR
jgi:hypothetical protein